MTKGFCYDQPVMMKIDKVINEAVDTKTFMFQHNLCYSAGQFIMVWLPGIDEKPFAVSYFSDDFFGITVLARGKFTRLLHRMSAGEELGIRGPFGHGFSIPEGVKDCSESVCIIGGGCGMASLTVLIDRLQGNPYKRRQEEHLSTPHSQKKDKRKISILMGAATKATLLFKNRFRDTALFTDDGSEGRKGYPTDILDDLHNKHRYNIIYSCGPEIMMFKVYEFCKKNNIQCEVSLERYMKCGIGICGQCVCDGQMVCKDGPVFNLQSLNKMDDFGSRSLLKSGQTVSIKDYGNWRSA